MRYWNWPLPTVQNRRALVDRLPMRYWNPPKNNYNSVGITRLIDYLWGIETTTVVVCSARTPVLIDYLWGIETLAPGHAFSIRQPLIDYLWGIETTNNTMSMLWVVWLIDYLWGIETTFWESPHNVNTVVDRLPMRYWNHRKLRLNRNGKSQLIDYLWGIETLVTRLLRCSELPLIDYLWGIETHHLLSPSFRGGTRW